MNLSHRKILIGIGLIAVVSGTALGSGAFTQVTADRSMTVEVADDSNGLVGISGGESNARYVTTNSNDPAAGIELKIDNSTLGGNANGLNPNATVTIDKILQLQNNAGESIDVSINYSEESALTFDLDSSTDTADSTVTLSSDGATTQVDLEIDTAQLSDGSNSLTVTVTANPTS